MPHNPEFSDLINKFSEGEPYIAISLATWHRPLVDKSNHSQKRLPSRTKQELKLDSVIKDSLTTAFDGKNYSTLLHNQSNN